MDINVVVVTADCDEVSIRGECDGIQLLISVHLTTHNLVRRSVQDQPFPTAYKINQWRYLQINQWRYEQVRAGMIFVPQAISR